MSRDDSGRVGVAAVTVFVSAGPSSGVCGAGAFTRDSAIV